MSTEECADTMLSQQISLNHRAYQLSLGTAVLQFWQWQWHLFGKLGIVTCPNAEKIGNDTVIEIRGGFFRLKSDTSSFIQMEMVDNPI